MMTNIVTAITVNYKTLDLLKESITAFRKLYSSIPLIVIDGSSYDESSNWLYEFAKKDKNTRVLFNNYNIHHGPGIDAGLRLVTTKYAFTFDTDTIIKDDILDSVFTYVSLINKEFYSIGTLHNVNNAGVDIMNPCHYGSVLPVTNIEDRQEGIHYIHPRAKLIEVKNYFRFPPFIKHGAPCILSYTHTPSILLHHFPTHKYILHPTGRGGTVSRTGGFHL